MEINVKTELEFARSFYDKAIEGVEGDVPPKPDAWLENWEELKSSWEETKVQLIGMAESKDTPADMVEDIHAFLRCTLSIYLDLMCSISILKFEDNLDPFLKPTVMTPFEAPDKPVVCI